MQFKQRHIHTEVLCDKYCSVLKRLKNINSEVRIVTAKTEELTRFDFHYPRCGKVLKKFIIVNRYIENLTIKIKVLTGYSIYCFNYRCLAMKKYNKVNK